jgi:hypothetical protein
MAQRYRPPEAPGVEGEKAERQVELEQGKQLLGQVKGLAEGRLDQTSDPDADIGRGGDISRETGSGVRPDNDQTAMRGGSQRGVNADRRQAAQAKLTVIRDAPMSLDPPGQEEQCLPGAFQLPGLQAGRRPERRRILCFASGLTHQQF